MKKNRPFKLKPSGKDYIWGGQRLNTEFSKHIDMNPLAETWECSTHPDGPSYVVGGEYDGKELVTVIKTNPAFLGYKHEGKTDLPILVKLIDANKDLSVQVHPTDEYAKEYENGQQGKTEMWYILDADEDASLVYGLNRSCTAEEIQEAINTASLEKYLNRVKVSKGETYIIPAGTIHAICSGCLIAEIQENSNLTYRLYDYGRVGKDGKKRPLHIDKALAVASLEKAEISYATSCEYFDVKKINLKNRSMEYCSSNDSYSVLLCIEGKGRIEFEDGIIEFDKGECIFIPADSVNMQVSGTCELLDIRG